MSSGENNNI